MQAQAKQLLRFTFALRFKLMHGESQFVAVSKHSYSTGDAAVGKFHFEPPPATPSSYKGRTRLAIIRKYNVPFLAADTRFGMTASFVPTRRQPVVARVSLPLTPGESPCLP